MELGLPWDDDLFEIKEKKAESPKQIPYNVKVCEKEYFFKNPSTQDDIQKQNITKFQADFWYRSGMYTRALEAYLSIHENPKVKSTTVERDIDESIIRCYLKIGNVSLALVSLNNLIKKQGEDTSLFLLLAEICLDTGHIQGQITCLKRCISLHSYNHNFWYSLAKAYTKTHQLTTESKSTNKDIKDTINSLLQSNTTSYKECLKLSIKCCHCKCTNAMILLDTMFMDGYDNISTQKSVVTSNQLTQGLMVYENYFSKTSSTDADIAEEINGKLTIQESYSYKDKSSCSMKSSKKVLKRSTERLQAEDLAKNTIVGTEKFNFQTSHSILSTQRMESNEFNDGENTNAEPICTCSSSKSVTNVSNAQKAISNVQAKNGLPPSKDSNSNDERGTLVQKEVPYLIVGQEDFGSCHFNMAIMKSTDNKLCDNHVTMKIRHYGLSLMNFFCLLRTRFLLQRAIWTSMSFVKEKLSKTMADVKEDISRCVLCQCGELKKCILKQMELEDVSLAGQKIEDLDMHSLYQGGGQKHWT